MNIISNARWGFGWLFSAFGLLFIAHGIYFSVEQVTSTRYLKNNLRLDIDENNRETVLESALHVAFDIPPHRGAGNRPQYGLQHPLLRALGPPADLVHQEGGHCGRRSRLLMAILDIYDIPSRKVHLINERFDEFHHNHHYVHAVVEVKVNGKWIVADPLYNVIYRMPNGGLASLDDIRNNRKDVFARTIERADTRYSPYYEELYTYDEYRKFIWNSFPGGEKIYGWLTKVIGPDRAANIPGPVIIEKPLLAISVASYLGAVIFLGIGLLILRSRNKRTGIFGTD